MKRLFLVAIAGLAFAIPATAQNLEKDIRDQTVAFRNAATLTPSDSTDLAIPAKSLYIGGAGDVKVDLAGNGRARSTVIFKAVPVGTVLKVAAVRVYATNTTATNIVSLW